MGGGGRVFDWKGGGVLACSKVKLVMSAVTHSSQHALLTSRTSSSLQPLCCCLKHALVFNARSV